ncbi:pyruvate, phosphate dikinase [Thermoanaerobacterium thermosaccharolyticum DSM 571]|uniref:Pyruvate, phosphate dikinase n=1 Tax=Thermoanaerobacterium thermosaccharolyticum (strain ATCC 7956 / DSM 571 / NCIMB 9385 / NCA 3814 / NCTC 13789 / WDCM 00135 / 2032) TaxID=580327 RepID=D9TPP3_THETC|nr:pyruvate, phosphate dikinase [Thermoanaerobacterium thermosaccharolyticum]ADL68725.1 pyruvate, phosphate dikinase [Thermoanaerobacterium thermosaccharolyticum DSM 571]
MAKKYVYLFSEGNASMRNLLGGKGANLAEMTNLGLPVPQGFTVTTEACTKYYEDGKKISDDIVEEIYKNMAILEQINNKKFGDKKNPLLVSVRSGARVSMPGMMDTILNLGLNDDTVVGLAEATNNERFAYDSYRRFIQMFSDVVMGIDKNKFEAILDAVKEENGAKYDTDLTAENLKEVVKRYKELYKQEMGVEFPQDPKVQLLEAVKAVFRSWDNPRAIVYRRLNDIPSDWGTAVNVQTMVFGNMGNDSGTGVAFTRNPATGEKALFGEFLMNAQGEDVVAGIRTPQPISTLKDIMPEVYNQFTEIANKLENHYRDMQDIEFTIERSKLYMLQTRNGKRTAQAALKVAIDLVNEGLIDEKEAVLRVDPKQLDQLLHPMFDAEALKAAKPIAKGLPASPGAAAGKVYFTADDAVEAAKGRGEKVVLVRMETSPEDIEGMVVAQGILTGRGGMTSHAAVVARGMGTCCVAGCSAALIDENEKVMKIGDVIVKEGDYISIDGSTGNVYLGEIKTVPPSLTGNFATLMGWADRYRKLKVKANADIPRDAKVAVNFGAEGIGLCRTEHMFFAEDRIPAMREMIVSKTEEQRRNALNKLLPMQRSDFEGLFEAMGEHPVTIRLLDPPLHEFLPHEDEDIKALANEMGMAFEDLKATVESLKEFNPMLGFRGCRLAVKYPEIAEMQTRAIIEAAINVSNKLGINIEPQIMIPLIGDIKEMKYVKEIIVKAADEVLKEKNANLKYQVGTMIEVPRAALTADEIAKEAEFFSFGTNDLTQLTFAFSRDDAGKFLESYYDKKIYDFDPFAKLDQNGVGKLVEMGTKLGRQTRPDLSVGICGEHGGDPSSIEFCHKAGLDYVSCSPYRVPIARLAAAQAAIKDEK